MVFFHFLILDFHESYGILPFVHFGFASGFQDSLRSTANFSMLANCVRVFPLSDRPLPNSCATLWY
jgi:hypothetical protein